MFWDRISIFYDLLEYIYNRKVYINTGKKVADLINSSDIVLECACGTGGISKYIASKCKFLYATDLSVGMLKQARIKCKNFNNVTIKKADIYNLDYKDKTFDKVIAGNVFHILSEPSKAIKELERVTKSGGKIIIPTYINEEKKINIIAVKVMEFLGAKYNKQFDLESYKEFFKNMGYENVSYYVVEGSLPCAIAVIKKQ